jgi:HEAT repeat protein
LAPYLAYGVPSWVRTAAIQAIGDWAKKRDSKETGRWVDSIAKLLEDPLFWVRKTAIQTIGEVGRRKQLTALRRAQDREFDGRVKKDIRAAIRKIESRR